MSTEINYKFYIRIVLPSLLAIALFIVSIFAFVIPSFEKNMLDGKKEMISELTHAAWSILEEYNQKVDKGEMTLDSAMHEAKTVIELMRYGSGGKDYFWIIDFKPNMVMHPYRPELNGTDLSSYADPEGTLLFIEAVKVVNTNQEGFIQYIWQWKDDSTLMVPKLSYVKAYQPWQWIIGTGIYLNDVAEEMALLKNRLLRISLFIILVISVMLLYMVRQSLFIERKRKHAEEDLQLSRLKYKSLVEASTEGTLMIIRHKIIFANLKLSNMLGFPARELYSKKFEDLFDAEWRDVLSKFTDPNKSVAIETRLKGEQASVDEVILSVSRVDYGNEEGYIVIAKEVTRQKRLEKESDQLTQELQLSLLLMNQPIQSFIRDMISCSPDTPVYEAAQIMTRKNQSAIFVRYNNSIIGALDEHDLKARVLAQQLPYSTSISELMSSPVVQIQHDALVYEALLLFKTNEVSHLLVKNIQGEFIGVISRLDILSMQHNSLDFTIREIEAAEDTETLVRIYSRTPVLVNALLESGDKTSNINHIITSISDAIGIRIIDLAIEKIGDPPCEFAFLALGSEGRKEQTLSTDQDNAIIFSDLPEEELPPVYAYFSKLANEINTRLNEVGYRFCEGNIMARNPKYTQPLSVWKEYFTTWITSGDPQSILDSSIFFDLRCIYGSEILTNDLVTHINNQTENQAAFFQHLAAPIIKFKSRLSMFGSIVGDEQTGESKIINIKKILLPLSGFARIYTLKHKLNETNTLKRFYKLYKLGVLTKEVYDELTLSFSVLMQLRLRFQVQAELNNRNPDNMVDISQLTAIEVTTLKKVLSELTNLQTQLSFDFKGGV